MGRRAQPWVCPQWCIADHPAEDEAGEVRHRGPTVALGVLVRHPEAGAQAVELLVEMHQTARDASAWLYIGDGIDQRLELSVESAGRLAQVLLQYPLSPAAG